MTSSATKPAIGKKPRTKETLNQHTRLFNRRDDATYKKPKLYTMEGEVQKKKTEYN